MIRTHFLSNGDIELSKNFNLSEFQSKDGADEILLDDELVSILQRVRDNFERPVNITSAYRSPEHNRSVGGEYNSKHTKGLAADFYIDEVDPLQIAQYLESIGIQGIGWYPQDGFVHVDTREQKSYWKGSAQEYVNSFFDF